MFFIGSFSCLWTKNTATASLADKNVVSGRGNVVNSLDQGTTGSPAKAVCPKRSNNLSL